MNPEAAAFLEKSRKFLVKADGMFECGWPDEAGRAAYLAGFHAVQALISEVQVRVPKTHSGVQTEFVRLTRDKPAFDSELKRFLSRAYNPKAVADYATVANAVVAPEHAARTIDRAKRFASAVLAAIADRDQLSLGGDASAE